MLMQEALRMLMKMKRMTQTQAAEYINLNQRAISRVMNGNRVELSQAIELLEYLGYELIVRERSGIRRRDDEILIDNIPEFTHERQIKAVEESIGEAEAQRIENLTVNDVDKEVDRTRELLSVDVKYTCRDKIMVACKGNEELTKTQVERMLGICPRTLEKRYGKYFTGTKISTEKLIEIIDKTSIETLNEKIKEYKMRVGAKGYNKIRRNFLDRVEMLYPDKFAFNKGEAAVLLNCSAPTVARLYGKYFVNGVISVNDLLNAYCVEKGKEK